MAPVPRFMLRHRFGVEPYLGTWGSYGPFVDGIQGQVDEKLATAQADAGVERLTLFTIVTDLDVDCPEGSRVHLPDGRIGYASAVARHNTGTRAPIDHAEIAVTVGSEYGPPLGGETVAILRRVAVGEDRYHNVRYETTETTVAGVAIRPTGADETATTGMDRVEVIFPPNTDVRATDRLRIRGLVYDVDGTPEQQHDPMTGAAPGVRVEAVRRTGAG